MERTSNNGVESVETIIRFRYFSRYLILLTASFSITSSAMGDDLGVDSVKKFGIEYKKIVIEREEIEERRVILPLQCYKS